MIRRRSGTASVPFPSGQHGAGPSFAQGGMEPQQHQYAQNEVTCGQLRASHDGTLDYRDYDAARPPRARYEVARGGDGGRRRTGGRGSQMGANIRSASVSELENNGPSFQPPTRRTSDMPLNSQSVNGAPPQSRMSKLKLCVCGTSSQLGRERSRLLKIEKEMSAKLAKLIEREERWRTFDGEVQRQEAELAARSKELKSEEAKLAAKLESLYHETERTKERHAAAEAVEESVTRQEREVREWEAKAVRRLEKARFEWKQLRTDATDIKELRARASEEESTLAARTDALNTQRTTEVRKKVDQVEAMEEVTQEVRERVEVKQAELEPVQQDIESKDADLRERDRSLVLHRGILEEKRGRIAEMEVQEVDFARKTAGQERFDVESERRLAQVWDQLQHRSSVLDDIERNMRSIRNDDGSSLDFADDAKLSEQPDRLAPIEDLELELTTAELSEYAWREKSRTLERAVDEMTQRLRQAEENIQDLTKLPVPPLPR